jgi:hypothetical protein
VAIEKNGCRTSVLGDAGTRRESEDSVFVETPLSNVLHVRFKGG